MKVQQDLIPGVFDWDDVNWDRVERVRFHVAQSFTYRYPAPVELLDQRLVVLPRRDGESARRLAHEFRMDAQGSVLEQEDEFGNTVLAIEVPRVKEAITFDARFVVERRRQPAPARGERRPPDPRLLLPTRLTEAGPRVTALASGARVHGGNLAQARAVSTAVRAALAYRHGVTGVHTTAEEALGLGVGVCQDFAHVMIAACRLLGVPARYVSGHLVGEGGTHAWVEVAEETGAPVFWALDPTHDRVAGLSYVPVATGRDYDDVAPTSGTYVGPPGGVLSSARRVAICGVGYRREAR